MNICIEDNDGDILYLTNQNVKAIKRIEVYDTSVSFEIQFNDGTSTYITFYFENYTIEPKQLEARVSLIRSKLIKKLNAGNEPEIMFKEINLKKKLKEKEETENSDEKQ